MSLSVVHPVPTRSESRGVAVGAAGSLTPRQLEVLALLADGHTQADAAQRLGMSVQTLKNHTAAVYQSLDVSGLVQAFRRLGWLVPTTLRSAETWKAEPPHEWRLA